MIFLDRQCPACHGHGCAKCHAANHPRTVALCACAHAAAEPDSFAECMRAWRLAHGRTFRELSAETGILPGTLSEIENGRRDPTEEQRKKIEEFMR